METSLYLAHVIGVFMIILAVGVLINRDRMGKLIEDFFKNSALVYIVGIFELMLGLLLVFSHNVWEGSWQVLITILGWLTVLEGSLYVLFPTKMKKIKQMVSGGAWTVICAVVAIAIGVYLLHVSDFWGYCFG